VIVSCRQQPSSALLQLHAPLGGHLGFMLDLPTCEPIRLIGLQPVEEA
jgi:hypothetical protein